MPALRESWTDLRIDEETIAAHLYTAGLPDPDLLIRTSGEMRISNFLLWQIAYSEIYITETLWPDFRMTELLEAILDYQKRDRRFGGLSPTSMERLETFELPSAEEPALGAGGRRSHSMKRVVTGLILNRHLRLHRGVGARAALPRSGGDRRCALLPRIRRPGVEPQSSRARPVRICRRAAVSFPSSSPTFVFIVLIALLALSLSLTSRELADALPFAAALVLGVIYVFGCLRAGIGLRSMSPFWLLFALSENWIGDAAAYYIGRWLGRHKLAPRISPAKTWEGAIASTAASLIYAYFYFPYLLKDVPLPWALAIAALGNIAGQIGDLCESAIKRGAGVKDSGTMLPGHGGWLDRIDSSLFRHPRGLLPGKH